MLLRRLVVPKASIWAGVLAVVVGCSAFGSDGTDTAPSPDGGDAASSADAPLPSNNPGIFCGGKYCDSSTDLCCSTSATPGTGRCVQKSLPDACPRTSSFEYGCDDGADCPSRTVCCGGFGSVAMQLVRAACLPLLDCKKTPSWVVLCDPNAAEPCPSGAACDVPDGGGYGFCSGL